MIWESLLDGLALVPGTRYPVISLGKQPVEFYFFLFINTMIKMLFDPP